MNKTQSKNLIECPVFGILNKKDMTENIAEIWKPIPNYTGYWASNFGNVKNETTILNQNLDTYGYLKAAVKVNGIWKSVLIHRLVLLAFVGESKLEVDHINGIKSDNRLENLEYVSCRENSIRYYKKMSNGLPVGVQARGDKFRAVIRYKKKLICSNNYKTIKEADSIYKKALSHIISLEKEDLSFEEMRLEIIKHCEIPRKIHQLVQY